MVCRVIQQVTVCNLSFSKVFTFVLFRYNVLRADDYCKSLQELLIEVFLTALH